MGKSASRIEEIVIHHSSGIFREMKNEMTTFSPARNPREVIESLGEITENLKFQLRFSILHCAVYSFVYFKKGFHASTATHLSHIPDRPVNYPRNASNAINLTTRVHLKIVLEINSPEMIPTFCVLDRGDIRADFESVRQTMMR